MAQKILEKIYSSLVLLNALKHIEYTVQIMDPKCDLEFASACLEDLAELLDAVEELQKMVVDGSSEEERDRKIRKLIETDPLFVIIEERLGRGALTVN